MDRLRTDAGLLELLDSMLPWPQSLGEWLRRMGALPNVTSMMVQVNQTVLLASLGKCKKVTLDIDASEVVAGKRDAQFTYNKNPGYMPIVGHIAETGMAGIRREGSSRGRGQCLGISHEHAQLMATMATREKSSKGFRDAALIAVMSDCLLRVSELLALQVSDIESEGTNSIIIRRSKTDQEGKGQAVYASDKTIMRVRVWLDKAGIDSGPVFRSVSKSGNPSKTAMTSQAVRNIIKRRAGDADISGAVGSHSMRIGMTQTLAAAGAGLVEIQTAGRWTSPAMPGHYARGQLAARGAVARLIYKAA